MPELTAIPGLDEAKAAARIDSDFEDALLAIYLDQAISLVEDVWRLGDVEPEDYPQKMKAAILYVFTYINEHREEADYKKLVLDVRALNPARKAAF